MVRDSLEQALADARVQEEELWSAIPQDLTGKTTNTQKVLKNEIDKFNQAANTGDPDVSFAVSNFTLDKDLNAGTATTADVATVLATVILVHRTNGTLA